MANYGGKVSNSDDIIDSRDVIERITELSDLQSILEDAKNELESADTDEERDEAQEAVDESEMDFGEDEDEELAALLALQDEASGYSNGDWPHGATLVRDSYFTEYAEDLVKDIGDLPRNIASYLVIDWEATAENIKQDYTKVDFDGEAYWIR